VLEDPRAIRIGAMYKDRREWMVENADYDPDIQLTLNREGISVNDEPGLTQA
jgi:hypothetical protein